MNVSDLSIILSQYPDYSNDPEVHFYISANEFYPQINLNLTGYIQYTTGDHSVEIELYIEDKEHSYLMNLKEKVKKMLNKFKKD